MEKSQKIYFSIGGVALFVLGFSVANFVNGTPTFISIGGDIVNLIASILGSVFALCIALLGNHHARETQRREWTRQEETEILVQERDRELGINICFKYINIVDLNLKLHLETLEKIKGKKTKDIDFYIYKFDKNLIMTFANNLKYLDFDLIGKIIDLDYLLNTVQVNVFLKSDGEEIEANSHIETFVKAREIVAEIQKQLTDALKTRKAATHSAAARGRRVQRAAPGFYKAG